MEVFSFLLLRLFTAASDFSPFMSFQGLIFVVDSNDRERVSESAEELSKMVSQSYT